jgi:hypothetical protein
MGPRGLSHGDHGIEGSAEGLIHTIGGGWQIWLADKRKVHVLLLV